MDSENGLSSKDLSPKYLLTGLQPGFYVWWKHACFGLGDSRCQLGRSTWGNIALHNRRHRCTPSSGFGQASNCTDFALCSSHVFMDLSDKRLQP